MSIIIFAINVLNIRPPSPETPLLWPCLNNPPNPARLLLSPKPCPTAPLPHSLVLRPHLFQPANPGHPQRGASAKRIQLAGPGGSSRGGAAAEQPWPDGSQCTGGNHLHHHAGRGKESGAGEPWPAAPSMVCSSWDMGEGLGWAGQQQ